MTVQDEVKSIVGRVFGGYISEAKAAGLLSDLNVHGGFNSKGFLGYDYANQQWVEVAA